MHINLIKKIIEEAIGKQAIELIEILLKKRNVNEFIIAKKLKLTINQTRNLLYKFSEKGVISFTRKKDKKKGWYTYFWTFEVDKALLFVKNCLMKEIEYLKNTLKSRENKSFYICKNCNIELTEENALLTDFSCKECGEILSLNADKKLIEEITRKINKLEQQLNIIDEEMGRREKETGKKMERDIKKKKTEKSKKLRKARLKRRREAKKIIKEKDARKKGKKIKKAEKNKK
ncbi:hypothetical protein HYT26_03715 [Candidatus Pacearchaeota archaeon]|nr:hypothetical protein [Candidatus Pacearchaeota archaeon]